MTDRLANIKARISVRNRLGIGRAGTPYDEVAREVVWLVAEVERQENANRTLVMKTADGIDRMKLRHEADLAALRQRVAELEAERDRRIRLREEERQPGPCGHPASLSVGTLCVGCDLAALRQRHAEAVELLVRASDMLHHTVFWTPDGEQHPHPDCPACQWQAAWLASEAKAALEGDHE